jgi:hypothetical protein
LSQQPIINFKAERGDKSGSDHSNIQIHQNKKGRKKKKGANTKNVDWQWPHNAGIDRRLLYRFKCHAALSPSVLVIIFPIITTVNLEYVYNQK